MALLTFSSLTPKDILDMTYIQFKNSVEALSRKLNWEIKMAVLSVAPKELKDEDYPLYTKAPQEERKFTMADALALKKMAGG